MAHILEHILEQLVIFMEGITRPDSSLSEGFIKIQVQVLKLLIDIFSEFVLIYGF